MNKLKITRSLAIFLFLFTSAGMAQEISWDIHQNTLEDYLKKEEQLGSQRLQNTHNHISFSGNAQPIIFQRKEESLPDLQVSYFFKESDSTMSHILYEWDVYNYEKEHNNQKSKAFQEAMVQKYKDLKEAISADFGDPKIKENYSNIAQKTSEVFNENSLWDEDPATEVELYSTVSNYYEKKGMVTINPTHRIRLYVRNTKPEIGEEELRGLEEKAFDFFVAIEEGDFEEARTFMSDLIKEEANDEFFLEIQAATPIEKGNGIYDYGYEEASNGVTYRVLYLSFNWDHEAEGGYAVPVAFDDSDKIVGIQVYGILYKEEVEESSPVEE